MSLMIDALNSIDFSIENKTSTYTNSNGIIVPRVTEILSRMIHKDTLMYWANSLGFKGMRYKEVLENAATMGTLAHEAIERYLKEKLETPTNIPFMGFLSWYNTVTDAGFDVAPIKVEEKLVCDWFGGTMDCLMQIGDQWYLMDFKTSNHVTFTYFLQLAAYYYMLKLRGIHVNGVIVLQLDKTEVAFKEYILDLNNIEHRIFFDRCEEAFLSIVYAYYNIQKVEQDFKSLKLVI